jgi:hypothetical protein
VNADTVPHLRTWLSTRSDIDRARIFSSNVPDIQKCESILCEYFQLNTVTNYPIDLGCSQEATNNNENSTKTNDSAKRIISRDTKLELSFYLADKYLLNFESSHCVPLPKSFFKHPWSEKQLLANKYSF